MTELSTELADAFAEITEGLQDIGIAVYKMRVAGREVNALMTDPSTETVQTMRGDSQQITGQVRWTNAESGGAPITDYEQVELFIGDAWKSLRLRRPRLIGPWWHAEIDAEYA